MDKRLLEIVLTEQKEELDVWAEKKFCSRKEEQRIDLQSSMAQVVIGVRRSGKSTLCYNALHKSGVKFSYVNFDDERLVTLNGEDLNDVLEILYKIYGDFSHLFIDEIQNIKEWYLFVNRLLRRGMRIIVTGSNAKLLSGELATHLTGRHRQIELFPFSFSEYCECNNVDTQTMTTKAIAFRRAAFDGYLVSGGFPELLHEKDSIAYVNTLVNNIIQRDIQERFKIKYLAVFNQLANHLLNNAPMVVINSELQNTFGLRSDHTVENYINYLKQAYLLVGLHRYSTKSRIRLRDEKCYSIDVALMNNRTNAFAGENMGWRLETIVYIELLRRSRALSDIYYYAEAAGESDFVVCRGNKAEMVIQVSFDISNEKTRRRELRGLQLASKATRCDNLWLITDHEREDVELPGGAVVHVIPAYEWLLQE